MRLYVNIYIRKKLYLQHLPDIKFNPNEYLEYPDNEDGESLAQLNEQQYIKDNVYLRANSHLDKEESTTNALNNSMYLFIIERNSWIILFYIFTYFYQT